MTVPTHVKGHILDWIITNARDLINDLNVMDRGISDLFLCLLKPKKQLRKVISRKRKGINISKFRSDVSALLRQSGSTDLYSHYTTCLRKLLDIHAPLTTRLVSDRLSAPWMSKEIQIAKKASPSDREKIQANRFSGAPTIVHPK